jgi:hypothetical protein
MATPGRCGNLLLGAALLAQGLASAPGDPIAAASARAMRPVPRVEAAAASAAALAASPRLRVGAAPEPTLVWVPARHVFVPGTGEAVLVPGHYERVISATQVFVPPLIVHTPSGAVLTVPAGERPPLDVRAGP